MGWPLPRDEAGRAGLWGQGWRAAQTQGVLTDRRARGGCAARQLDALIWALCAEFLGIAGVRHRGKERWADVTRHETDFRGHGRDVVGTTAVVCHVQCRTDLLWNQPQSVAAPRRQVGGPNSTLVLKEDSWLEAKGKT